MRHRIVFAVALGLAAASPAQADSNWIGANALLGAQRPGWFIAPGTEPGYITLPSWNSTATIHGFLAVGAPTVFNFSQEPQLTGGAHGASVGYVLGDGALPPWLGQRVRIGLTGTYLSYQDKTNDTARTVRSRPA